MQSHAEQSYQLLNIFADADVDVLPIVPPSITFAGVKPTIQKKRSLIPAQDLSDVAGLVALC